MSKSERGLVITRHTEVIAWYTHHAATNTVDPKPDIQMTMRASLDPQELRSHLLFWDRLIHPITVPGQTSSPEEDFLIDAKILERKVPPVDPIQKLGAINHIYGVVSVFDDLNAREPGRWSLAEPKLSQYLDAFLKSQQPARIEPDRGVLIQLFDCIPVPDQDVPLADILDFKRKRQDEFLALRLHLEDIYQNIAGAPDQPQSLATELAAIDRAVVDALKVTRESPIKFKWGGLGANVNIAAGAIAFEKAVAYGLPLTQALMVGAGAIFVPKLGFDIAAGLKGASTAGTPYRYVSSYHREVFR